MWMFICWNDCKRSNTGMSRSEMMFFFAIYFYSKKICLDINQCVSDHKTLMDGMILPRKTKICQNSKYHQVI